MPVHATPLTVRTLPISRRRLLRLTALLAVPWALGGSGVARANRFGPPWQARVTAERTIVYGGPDRSSTIIGPLPRGAVVVVLGETKGADGADWTAIPDGFVPSADILEEDAPWIAEATLATASVYAKPNARDVIRRTVRRGDLLRVTGISPGLDGDTGVWWSTTEGYLPLGSLQATRNEWANGWTMPDPAEAAQGWWGAIRAAANVRAGATTASPVVGLFGGGERVKVLAEEQGEAVQGSATWYRIDGGRYAGARVHSSLVARLRDPSPTLVAPPPGAQAADGAWITVRRADYTLTFAQNGQVRFTTYVALGKAGVQTPPGDYSTFGKFRVDDMTSSSVPDAERSYDLPNVPSVQYYLDGGYAIHGTYWHDYFGTNQSQGCINLSVTDGAYLFGLTQPVVPDGTLVRWSRGDAATPVVILT